MFGGHLLFQQGYDTYKPRPFSVRVLGFGTMVMITGEAMRDEVKKLPENVLSSKVAINQVRFSLCYSLA